MQNKSWLRRNERNETRSTNEKDSFASDGVGGRGAMAMDGMRGFHPRPRPRSTIRDKAEQNYEVKELGRESERVSGWTASRKTVMKDKWYQPSDT